MQELNTSDLEQHPNYPKIINNKNGPLVAILPPTAFGDYRHHSSTWTRYVLIMYFLRTSFADENGLTRSPSVSGSSTVNIEEDWQAMQNVAKDFLKATDQWFIEGLNNGIPLVNKIRFKSRKEDVFTPISLDGNDKRSGVKVVTQIEINDNCGVSDYTSEELQSIITQNLQL